MNSVNVVLINYELQTLFHNNFTLIAIAKYINLLAPFIAISKAKTK